MFFRHNVASVASRLELIVRLCLPCEDQNGGLSGMLNQNQSIQAEYFSESA